VLLPVTVCTRVWNGLVTLPSATIYVTNDVLDLTAFDQLEEASVDLTMKEWNGWMFRLYTGCECAGKESSGVRTSFGQD
jgi:hypothetical protein